jgi:hypothetical protein
MAGMDDIRSTLRSSGSFLRALAAKDESGVKEYAERVAELNIRYFKKYLKKLRNDICRNVITLPPDLEANRYTVLFNLAEFAGQWETFHERKRRKQSRLRKRSP